MYRHPFLIAGTLAFIAAVIVAVVAVGEYVRPDAVHNREPGNLFVELYIHDLSRGWDFSDVLERTANKLMWQLSSDEGVEAITRLKRLGPLVRIMDVELIGENDGPEEPRVRHYLLKGEFENALAVLKVSLVEGDAGLRVLNLIVRRFARKVGDAEQIRA